jgi:hypothetical protein
MRWVLGLAHDASCFSWYCFMLPPSSLSHTAHTPSMPGEFGVKTKHARRLSIQYKQTRELGDIGGPIHLTNMHASKEISG